MYDLAILGGGPAGVGAGVYASRKRLKTLFITKDWNGQSSVSSDIQNWIGTISISGIDLAKNLEKHLKAYAGDVVDIKEGESVELVTKIEGGFEIKTDKGGYTAKTILVTTGSHRRKLEIPGAKEFDNKGITYCATCDGPLFAGTDVVVIGGGNAAFETSAQLLAYCKSVTLLNRSKEFRADPVTVKKVLSDPKMKAITSAQPVEIKGEKFIKSIVYQNETGEKIELKTQGIFAEIGAVPTTYFVKNLVNLDPYERIIVDPKNQKTSTLGIWSAGDCTNSLYQQNNIAVGDAIRALEDIYMHLRAK